MAARILKSTLTCLPTGTKWKTVDGHTYEVTGAYCIGGNYGYHILEDGKRGPRWAYPNGSPRLIPEEDVKELRRNKV